ncbi:MAG: hypothetical protein AAB225_23145 [Acidobacteriota bacterium]
MPRGILVGDTLYGSEQRMKPNFTGTWRLNLERSRLEIPAPSSSTVRIEHREPSFALSARHVYGERSRDVHFDLTNVWVLQK